MVYTSGTAIEANQLEALKRYEKATSERREAMRLKLLPGRQYLPTDLSSVPASPPDVVPSPSHSQVLPTDPDALHYPNKTLETVSPTGVIGNLKSDECDEQRSQDADYCRRHFAGHVLHSSLEVVLTRLGASELVHKLAELKKVADTQLNATLKASVVKNFDAESATTSNPADRTIDGRYWLCRLADAARGPAADDSLLALDYFPTPPRSCPGKSSTSTTIFNVLVNVELTKVKPPPVQYNPLIGASSPVAKYQQAITNADDVLTFQPTRLFVPTLSFHGKGKSTQLFVSILSQERFEFAVVENCFASAGFPTVSALLHLFRTASLYHLGYNPLFTYNLSSPPPNFSVGDAVPASVILPGAPGVVHLNGKRLSQLRSTPFKRSTVVLEGELDETSPNDSALKYDEQFPDDRAPLPVVVKLSFIAEARLWRERIIVDALHTADLQPAPAYAPKILAAFAAHGLPPPSLPDSKVLQTGKRSASALQSLPTIVSRHLEAMVFASPHHTLKLKDLPAAVEFLAAAEQLFRAILDAYHRRILHRDISVNNILVANNQLLMVDWEIGRSFQEVLSAAGRGVVTGTLDTMSVASLGTKDPLPHDDLESAVYVLLKVLTQTFVPHVDQQNAWAEVLRSYHWDNPDVEVKTLQQIRRSLWRSDRDQFSTVASTLEIFRSAGHASRAQLVLALLSLPLPTQRGVVDSSDHKAVLSSLKDLVDQAVAAVHSVDATDFLWGSAGEVNDLAAGQEGSE
ncbi:Pkinase-fungal domain-containing protein [Mycena venus]|uniref:Pkinase-fungal domain-containing protein n=1 Tax=Mycena venus TaxID=2733690 RepID=A0A8H7CT92_9AGAR|nr:Pkinase-fungal domain-containing protein [Mycena venus]